MLIKLSRVACQARNAEIAAQLKPAAVEGGQSTGVTALGCIAVEWQGSQTTPQGAFRSTLTVQTSDKEYPTLRIPVLAYVSGDVQVQPSKVILLGRKGSQIKVERLCTVTMKKGAVNPSELELSSQDGPVTGQLDKVSENGETMTLRVKLGLRDQAADADQDGALGKSGGTVEGSVKGTANGTEIFSIPYLVVFTGSNAAATRD